MKTPKLRKKEFADRINIWSDKGFEPKSEATVAYATTEPPKKSSPLSFLRDLSAFAIVPTSPTGCLQSECKSAMSF